MEAALHAVKISLFFLLFACLGFLERLGEEEKTTQQGGKNIRAFNMQQIIFVSISAKQVHHAN